MLPFEENKFSWTVVSIDQGAQIEACGDVPDPRGMVPVQVASRPLGPRQLDAPQRPGLRQHTPTLVHQNAVVK